MKLRLLPGDVIFTLKELKHPLYNRCYNDLIYYHSISLKEALCGTILNIKL